jgi:hydroxylamine reductase
MTYQDRERIMKMSMFCFQCEQTAKGSACTVSGVCGKQPETSDLQDKLTGKMVALAKAAKGRNTSETDELMVDGLFTTVTNVSFDDVSLTALGVKIDMATAAFWRST